MKMELWVRSQDKENLIPIKNPICVYDNKIIYKESASYVITIGTYKIKERAIEVLDEIQNILKPQLIIKDSGKIIGSFEDTIVREGATYELKELSTYVYQMPKD